MERSNCLDVASLDTDLQRVIAAWHVLPEAIRAAIMALIGTIAPRSEMLPDTP
ncbi:MAG TPA: hypothetical protein VHV55_07520 [Pirellulales bacterium]|jgi:hypothetical protein|nr:hypothetical protein [Pirellulales bacterium]